MKVEQLGLVGIVLLGAEGCSETQDENWLRDSTEEEQTLFIDHYTKLMAEKGDVFDLQRFTVDNTCRPYWFKTVLDVENLPKIAREKAEKYSRVVRLTE